MARLPSNLTTRSGSRRGAGKRRRPTRPVAGFRQRGIGGSGEQAAFFAQEDWHEPRRAAGGKPRSVRFIVQEPGRKFVHPVSVAEIRERLNDLPDEIAQRVEVIQLSRMTRKRQFFPRYGMQWGSSVYLYPIEESLVETYVRPPTPQQLIEARMFGGVWSQSGNEWRLTWTADALKDFYLNNVLIHEIGHLLDSRNTRTQDRERFANWFAIEYGYRASRQPKFDKPAAS